jgi:sulfoxide reductase catalytic subunit YedY
MPRSAHIRSTESKILPSDITPQAIYQERRQWLQLMATGAAGAGLAAWAGREALAQTAGPGKLAKLPFRQLTEGLRERELLAGTGKRHSNLDFAEFDFHVFTKVRAAARERGIRRLRDSRGRTNTARL